MKTPLYNSTLRVYILGLVEEKHLHGFQSESFQYILAEIDRYMQDNPPQSCRIDEAYFNNWLAYADNPNLSRKTVYAKVSSFRQLMIYMNNLGIDCFVPRLPRMCEHRFVPHIYSEKEMLDIFDACDNLKPHTFRGRTCCYALPALFRLLYSTGIRLGEAFAIKNKDVDFKKKHIFINKTKNCRQRFAPINKTLEPVLKEYIAFRSRITCKPIDDPSSPFFVNNRGDALTKNVVQHIFNHVILAKAGIPYIGHHAGPRIHDIRHTACVHALKKLVSQGYDLYCCMPLLANFMGHLNPMSTETYLRLTQEVYPDVIGAQISQSEDIAHILSRSVTIKF